MRQGGRKLPLILQMNTLQENFDQLSNETRTENGAGAYQSTLNVALDVFASVGDATLLGKDRKAAQRASETLLEAFAKAFSEDRKTAIKIMVYTRDIKGGVGLRDLSRKFLSYVAEYLDRVDDDALMRKIIDAFINLGRWDDIFTLFDHPIWGDVVKERIFNTLRSDLSDMREGKPISLLAKWLKSINTSSPKSQELAKRIRDALGMTSREYRQMLSAMRSHINVIEQKMSAGKWSEIDFETVPSQAMIRYRKAFARRDPIRWADYLNAIEAGDAKINTGTLWPHQIVAQAMNGGYGPRDVSTSDRRILSALWDNLPNTFGDIEENSLVIPDISGSMVGLPIAISVALAIYAAQRNKGKFHNRMISFSDQPRVIKLKDSFDIISAVRHVLDTKNVGYNTDLFATFKLLVQLINDSNASENDVPKRLYIISDMEFDEANVGLTHNYYYGVRGHHTPRYTDSGALWDTIREYWRSHCKRTIPEVVFWNVNNRVKQFPVTIDDNRVIMVSSFSAQMYKYLLNAPVGELSPVSFMESVLAQYNWVVGE